VAELERVGDNTAALVLLDREMSQRRAHEDAGAS
jgi:hypothetical protein